MTAKGSRIGFFNRGVTRANLKEEGKHPVDKEEFTREVMNGMV